MHYSLSGFAKTLVQRHIVSNALRVSLVVGTLLNTINHGSQFLNGNEIAWGQVLLNFMVPYCVASYSAAKNEVERNNSES
ncbi:nitrate/nitrite transporter NrtS [Dasania sp. GY-MA-18]|uniref:Nitrate/nitrite transporter NrtS n=1 Tax=Dasania phycosphaerae TaxID=2950436 RepID=A0A9J6RIV2_9GAMM|nr:MULTISPECIES: nitrate/nitrite transporter NrtS [Dasania]MCR8921878.1 nitrate/nitrite transporter NrtS [Dasania sp. GY-MA-18]MCZ0864306.1 nitrate/nitrite transporter NrtS [Dasania phycosphaerae]MCZ0868034.1 nitrate/nitrite transporter NrtS [Dasania phycosphaerae]